MCTTRGRLQGELTCLASQWVVSTPNSDVASLAAIAAEARLQVTELYLL